MRSPRSYLLALSLAVTLVMCFLGTAVAASGIVAGREASISSAGGLNIRADSTIDSAIVDVASEGDYVHVVDGPKHVDGVEWYKVEYDASVGWVAGKYLEPARARTVSRGGSRASITASAAWLAVPYRSQLDGTAYQSGNCGPTSLAMALEAFGKFIPTTEIRRAANKMQGTTGWYDSGVHIDVLAKLAVDYGMVVRGLHAGGGYDQWSLDEVRAALRAGHLVVPQVHLASLPGQEHSDRSVDHYIVLVGYEGDNFYYHDPAFVGWVGQGMAISSERLQLAWKRGDFGYAAFSLAAGPELIPLIDPPKPPESRPAESAQETKDAPAPTPVPVDVGPPVTTLAQPRLELGRAFAPTAPAPDSSLAPVPAPATPTPAPVRASAPAEATTFMSALPRSQTFGRLPLRDLLIVGLGAIAIAALGARRQLIRA